jgi:ankyrin repeat protein
MKPNEDRVDAFVEAACAPLDSGHASGTLDRAQAILAEHPGIATRSIFTAAILGDDAAVRRFLEIDPSHATAKGGPRNWDALTHLCFSRFLRLDRARSEGFVRAATALLDAGASANTGWFEKNHQPEPEWESALYGAAGVAHHAGLTRLLLERGADPNDGETPYHAPETRDNRALEALVESGRLNDDSLTTLLLRKADWHDLEGIRYLLAHGADPNRMTRWRNSAFHHALRRDNAMNIIDAMLAHGADPLLKNADGRSAVAMAAWEGRSDVLERFAQRGIATELQGLDRLVAACAMGDAAAVRAAAHGAPDLVAAVIASGGPLLAKFSGTGNPPGVRQLLDLGVPVDAMYEDGDGYWGIAKRSLPMHVAAWRLQHAVVRLLIERGSPVDVPDGRGRTPLMLAVRACVDSYWTGMRAPDSVHALLDAGASVKDVMYPSGYADVDALLGAHWAKHAS